MSRVVSGLAGIRCANKSGCHDGRGWSLKSEEEREIDGSSREFCIKVQVMPQSISHNPFFWLSGKA